MAKCRSVQKISQHSLGLWVHIAVDDFYIAHPSLAPPGRWDPAGFRVLLIPGIDCRRVFDPMEGLLLPSPMLQRFLQSGLFGGERYVLYS